MTQLKCKMCGGTIVLTGETHGVCEFCRTEVTLPKIDDDKRAKMYDRANHFRQKCRFDEAREAFLQILAEDQSDAEAYWQILLCRYGIEYVEDPRTGERKPTCHFMNYDSILNDPDYLKALEHSDEYTKSLYRKEASYIQSIQEEYLEISRKEKPYDVFICFKQTDENRNETQDCVDAEELYDALTEKGLRVFFSKRTLKLGTMYEPYIFAALNSAKVMLVVTSSIEHLNSPWVRNEWSRFIDLQSKDKGKQLIPVYRNIDPYDLPAEFAGMQGQNYAKIGAKQDIVHGVLSILGKTPVSAAGASAAVGATVSTLLKRAKQAIDDEQYGEAKTHCNRILDSDPDNAKAHFYMFLAQCNAKNVDEVNKDVDWRSNTFYKRALMNSDEETKKQLDVIEKNSIIKWKYETASDYVNKEQYSKAIPLLKDTLGYKNSAEKLKVCEDYLQRLRLYTNNIDALCEEISEPNYFVKNTRDLSKDLELYDKLKAKKNMYNKLSGRSHTNLLGVISLIVYTVAMFLGFMEIDENAVMFVLYAIILCPGIIIESWLHEEYIVDGFSLIRYIIVSGIGSVVFGIPIWIEMFEFDFITGPVSKIIWIVYLLVALLLCVLNVVFYIGDKLYDKYSSKCVNCYSNICSAIGATCQRVVIKYRVDGFGDEKAWSEVRSHILKNKFPSKYINADDIYSYLSKASH